MDTIMIIDYAGVFAENKDVARDLRTRHIAPALQSLHTVVLDFEGVDGATQSFIHALISELIRDFGAEILDHIVFKNCNPTIQNIISIVADYMQESWYLLVWLAK